MKVVISSFRQTAGNFYIKFKAETPGGKEFEVEAMVSGSEAQDKTNEEIGGIALSKVRATIEYRSTQLDGPPSVNIPGMEDQEVQLQPSRVMEIRIYGQAAVYASDAVPSESQYDAVFIDQYGEYMRGASPTWNVSPTVPGITMSEAGKLVVARPDWANVGNVTITATSGEIVAEFVVTINPPVLTESMKAEIERLKKEAEGLRARDTLMQADNNFILDALVEAGII